MSNRIWFSFFLLCIFSCDSSQEKYLFKEGTDEYNDALALAASQCVTNAKIFDVLDENGDFLNFNILNKIYKISQDANDAVVIYAKITDMTATEIEITYDSINTEYQKILTYEKTDHDDLLSQLKIMACNQAYSDYFTASSLTSTTSMNLTWKKKTIDLVDSDEDSDTVPELYKQRTDTYTFSKSYPLYFFFYNATKVLEQVITENESENEDPTTLTSKITITDVTDADECGTSGDYPVSGCDFEDAVSFPACDLVIETGKYDSNDWDDELISIDGTDCELLDSTT